MERIIFKSGDKHHVADLCRQLVWIGVEFEVNNVCTDRGHEQWVKVAECDAREVLQQAWFPVMVDGEQFAQIEVKW